MVAGLDGAATSALEATGIGRILCIPQPSPSLTPLVGSGGEGLGSKGGESLDSLFLCISVKQIATETETLPVKLLVISSTSGSDPVLERLRNLFRTPSETPSEPPAPAAETANISTLHALAERVVALEAQQSQLMLAWGETLDKLGRWASKQAARERRRVDRDLEQLAGDGPETHEDPPESTNGAPPVPMAGQDRLAVKAQLRARAAQLYRR